MICRTQEEVRAAAQADHDEPLDQSQSDLVAAILQTVQAQGDAA